MFGKTSNFVGVSRRDNGKFTAQLKVVLPPKHRSLSGTNWHLGTFNSELFAAIVRDIAAAAYWGRRGCVQYNFFKQEHLPAKPAVTEHPAWQWAHRNRGLLSQIEMLDYLIEKPCPCWKGGECICAEQVAAVQKKQELWAKIHANEGR